MKKRLSEKQVIGFLQEVDAGISVKELCRTHGFAGASYSNWRAKFGGMSVSEAKRLRQWCEAMLDRTKQAKPERLH